MDNDKDHELEMLRKELAAERAAHEETKGEYQSFQEHEMRVQGKLTAAESERDSLRARVAELETVANGLQQAKEASSSCLVCGRMARFAVWSMPHPEIVVCSDCREAVERARRLQKTVQEDHPEQQRMGLG